MPPAFSAFRRGPDAEIRPAGSCRTAGFIPRGAEKRKKRINSISLFRRVRCLTGTAIFHKNIKIM